MQPGHNAQALLTDLVARIERLEEEKKALTAGVRDVYAEAKVSGFDVKALRRAVALRRLDDDERDAFLSAVDLYLGSLDGTAP